MGPTYHEIKALRQQAKATFLFISYLSEVFYYSTVKLTGTEADNSNYYGIPIKYVFFHPFSKHLSISYHVTNAILGPETRSETYVALASRGGHKISSRQRHEILSDCEVYYGDQ